MLVIHICSLFIFLALLLCWAIPKKLYFEGRTVFFGLMTLTLLTILFDIFVTYVACTALFSEIVIKWLFKIYFIILYLCAYFQFLFLLRKSLSKEVRKRVSLLSIIAPVCTAILVLIFDMNIYILEGGVSITGPSVMIAFGSVGLTAAFIIYFLIKRRKSINYWYSVCYRSAVALWLFFSISQFLSTRLGYVSMGITSSLIPIFAFIETPLNYTDYKYSCFKNNYIEKQLKKLVDSNTNGFIFLIDVEDTNRLKIANDDINSLRQNIIKVAKKDRNISIFITEKGELFIVGLNTEDYLYYKDRFNIMIEEFYKTYENQQTFRSLTISCSSLKMFSHETELIDYIRYTQQRLSNNYYYNTSFEITDTDLDLVHNENDVKKEIIDALEEDRIEAFIQPIYSVEQKRIISAEALARIRRKDGSIMPPNQFIPISEKTGLDILIGYRIVEKICQFMHDPVSKDLFDYIDINLSIAQCESVDLASKIITITQKYDIKPNRLNFEITETGFINKMSIIEKNIKALTDYGFGFSLDDFGNGESNLNYLITMPVSYVKLDMHMIWDYFKNIRAKKTVQSIIKISHDMGYKVVAEGVETLEQLNELSNEGVDFVQGYYFFKPMSFNEYLDIVKKEKRQSNLDTKGSDETMDEKQNYASFDTKGASGESTGFTKEVLSSIISPISSIFLSMHLLDLQEKTAQEFTTFDNARVILSKDIDVQKHLNDLLVNSVTNEYKEKALQFANLSSISEKLSASSFVTGEFIGSVHGWIKTFIIPVKMDDKGNVISFWYLVQHIDEDKKRIKMLEDLSYADELTGLPNRRAFDKKIESMKYDLPDNLVVISFDVNNLKHTNDNYGHHAGDELIRTAGEKLKKYLEKYGYLFRTGGDEFVALLTGNYSDISDSLDHMIREVNNWKSNNFEGTLSLAYGVSTSSDIANGNFYDYEKFAETRMFKNKSQYYVDNHIERRKNPIDRRKGGDRRN